MNMQAIEAAVAQANANIAEAGPLMSEAATMIERQHDIITRLVAMLDDVRDNSEGHYPPLDSGCIACTQGATPNRYNTGPCAYHAALRLLGGKKDTSKPISASLRLQCLLQAQFIEGKLKEIQSMPPGVRIVFEDSARLLNEVAK